MPNDSFLNPCCHRNGKHVFWFFNSVVGFLILVGNILTCAVFLQNKRMRRERMNLFLVSLAMSDIFVAILVIPGYSVVCMNCVYLGNKRCWIFETIKDFAFLTTIFNVLAITYDRYLAVLKPLQYKSLMTQRRATIILSFVWIVPAFLMLAQRMWQFSAPKETSQLYNKIYSYIFLFTFVFIPVALMLIVNVKIIFAIRKAKHKDFLQMQSIKKPQEDEWSTEDFSTDLEGHENFLLTRWLKIKADSFISFFSSSTLSRIGEQTSGESEFENHVRVRSYSHGPIMSSQDTFPPIDFQSCNSSYKKENAIEKRFRSYSTNTNEIYIPQLTFKSHKSPQCSCNNCASSPLQQRFPERLTTLQVGSRTPPHLESATQQCRRNRHGRRQRGSFLHLLHAHAKRKRLEHHIRTRHGTISCILVVTGFVITWLPHSCVKLYQLFSGCSYVCPCLVNVSLCFLFVQSSINPLIYGFYRLDFRKATKQMLCGTRRTRMQPK